MKHLAIYLDFKSPASYLAVKPTRHLIDDLKVDAVWRPFSTMQKPTPTKQEDETKGQTHRRIRAEYRDRSHSFYAGIQDLQWPRSYGQGPHCGTTLALVGLILNPVAAYMDAAFNAYWVNQLDLDDRDVVNALLDQSGSAQFLPDAQRCTQLFDTAMEHARAHGVIDAPTYLIDEELFVGREHLPWIRELLLT